MKLIVGLGNPGEKFNNTRHNVGFVVLELLAHKFGVEELSESKKFEGDFVKSNNLIFLKPQTFMNNSGSSVKKIVDHYKIETPDIWVIHDDLDIALGEFKIQKEKGPKEHKGVLSVEELLGKKDFNRVRVGVENRKEKKISGEDYVLQRFTDKEEEIIREVIDNIVNRLTNDLS